MNPNDQVIPGTIPQRHASFSGPGPAAGQRKRTAFYARVSTDSLMQENSYENQVEIYTTLIRSNPDWIFAGGYTDKAISGTSDDRPGFRRLMEDCEAGRIDLILVKSISRWARNTLVTVQTIRKLTDLGVAVIFQKENIDTSRPYSRMLMTILAAFAEEESYQTSLRVRKGLEMRAENGHVRWIRTFGYRKGPDGTYLIEPDEADIIRRIFHAYEHGDSIAQIVQQLNR